MIAAGCRLNGRSGHEASWALLETLYQMETGLSLPPVSVTPRGKPHFPEGKYHFSISHTHRHAVCVLSRDPVGIDAEELDRPVRLKLAERILSPGEFARFSLAEDKRRALLTLWVMKEADAKRSGQGLQGFPNNTDFSLDDPRVWEWDGCLICLMSEDTKEGVTFYAF